MAKRNKREKELDVRDSEIWQRRRISADCGPGIGLLLCAIEIQTARRIFETALLDLAKPILPGPRGTKSGPIHSPAGRNSHNNTL